MRRMITEKDVEKLDSIKPSEIEKLGAMQDPKTAQNGFVLTANGKGQSTYRAPAPSGIKISYSSGGGGGSIYKEWFERPLSNPYSKDKFPGYKVAIVSTTSGAISFGFSGFPYYDKSDNTRVYIAPGDYFVMQGEYTDLVFGVKNAVYEKFVADTADQSSAEIYTGKDGQHYSHN